jgi:hypothetical protein
VKQQISSVLGRLSRRLHAQAVDEPSTAGHEINEGTDVSSPPAIVSQYVLQAPSPQNAIDIFRGEWSSRFPAEAAVEAGSVPLFTDDRVDIAARHLGGLADYEILELGPLEGAHTWMLSQLGAASVIAVEANSRAYLKCLISKEILGIPRARFLLGDFLAYLNSTEQQFDLILASGVLYHMQDPVALLELIASHTNRVVLWTHYYEDELISASHDHARMFAGTVMVPSRVGVLNGHKRLYLESQESSAFCGGGYSWSIWMERPQIMALLRHLGFNNLHIDSDEPSHPNGPSFLVTAWRGSPELSRSAK